MLLTTPTSLSFLEESSLRTNNSSSHIILLSLIIITLSLSLLLLLLLITRSSPVSPVSPLPPLPLFQRSCHHSLSSAAPVLPQSTLSLSSQCCIDFCKASPVISPYLLIPTLTPSLSTLQGCFHFPPGSHINNLPLSHFLYLQLSLSGTHTVFPFQI